MHSHRKRCKPCKVFLSTQIKWIHTIYKFHWAMFRAEACNNQWLLSNREHLICTIFLNRLSMVLTFSKKALIMQPFHDQWANHLVLMAQLQSILETLNLFQFRCWYLLRLKNHKLWSTSHDQMDSFSQAVLPQLPHRIIWSKECPLPC